MKALFLTLVLLISIQSFGQTISVSDERKALYGVVEATWCGLCGQFGHPGTEEVIDATDPNAVYLGLHKSATSALHSPTAEDIVNEFGISGQPRFTVNGFDFGAYSTSTISMTIDSINDYYLSSGAAVNSGFNCVIEGSTIMVNTRTEFFQELTGNYQMAVYVYEDSIWEHQTNYEPGPDTNIWHNHILRSSMNGSFGESVGTGTITAGTEVELDYELAVDPSWNPDQLHIVTVIWEENAGDYAFVNANDSGGTINSVTMEELPQIAFKLYPNPTVNGTAKLSLNQAAQVTIVDMNGKAYYQEKHESGISQLNLDLSNGMYVVQVQTISGVSQKIMIVEN